MHKWPPSVCVELNALMSALLHLRSLKRKGTGHKKKATKPKNLKLKNNKKIKIFNSLLFVKKPPTCSPTHIRHPKRPQK